MRGSFIARINDDSSERNELLKRYNQAIKETRIRFFSDSIVVAAPADKRESLAVLIQVIFRLQTDLYELDTPVFLRGAITMGDIYIRKDIIFGQGLIEAYIAQEELAIYPRVIISEEVLTSGIPISQGDKYISMKSHIECILGGYTESKSVRNKYLWLRKDLDRAVEYAEK